MHRSIATGIGLALAAKVNTKTMAANCFLEKYGRATPAIDFVFTFEGAVARAATL
jgi:hypothetical protein